MAKIMYGIDHASGSSVQVYLIVNKKSGRVVCQVSPRRKQAAIQSKRT